MGEVTVRVWAGVQGCPAVGEVVEGCSSSCLVSLVFPLEMMELSVR